MGSVVLLGVLTMLIDGMSLSCGRCVDSTYIIDSSGFDQHNSGR